jgi:hypothetical protein
MGLALVTLGILLLSRLSSDTSYLELSVYELMIGAGLGLSMQTIVIALQNAVDFKDLGVATSANTFFRSIGSTIGVALFGSIYANRLGIYLPQMINDLKSTNPAALVGATPQAFEELKNNSAVIKTFSPELQSAVFDSFVHAFHDVFIAAAPVTLVGLILSLFLRETPLRTNEAFHAAREEAAGEQFG